MKKPQILYISDTGRADNPPADSVFQTGVLETMRANGGRIPLWRYHRARLSRCTGRSPAALLEIELAVEALAIQCKRWVAPVRVRLRYGVRDGAWHWDLTAAPLDTLAAWSGGVRLYPCSVRFPPNPDRHHGCKMLDRSLYNRAAAELNGQSPDVEGIVLDAHGNVIESLRCNLLLFRNGGWETPRLASHGVQGVMRTWLCDRVSISENEIDLQMLRQAQEVALCNSLRGVIPVTSLLGFAEWPIGPETTQLQHLVENNLW